MRVISTLLLSIGLLTALYGCRQTNSESQQESSKSKMEDVLAEKAKIASLLDSFNMAASAADYDKYFSFFTADATFIGTDATEHWDKNAFMIWAKPYFDKKTTWHFTSLDRHIYFGKNADIAWFDELLNTQMKICRGSGVVVRQNDEWKVQQYVLSTTIPNSKLDAVIDIKASIEDSMIRVLGAKQTP